MSKDDVERWMSKDFRYARNTEKGCNRRRLRISETASGLRGFVRQFRIEGIPRHGPREFMQIARRDILNLMRANRQTRVRMILTCEMTREELFSKNIQILNSFSILKLLKILKQPMNQKSLTLSFKRLKKEFRILIREDPIGDFKEFYLLISTLQISNRFVDPLSFRFQKKSITFALNGVLQERCILLRKIQNE